MRFVLYLFLLAGRIVMFPLYFVCGFLPRRHDEWVFGSWGGHRFADNSAAFFRYCTANADDGIKRTWVSRERSIVESLREKGYVAHTAWSPGGIAACLRADVYIYDCFVKDINFWLSRGARRICLWSGVPLKVFERDIDKPGSRYYRLFHGSLPERWGLAIMMPWHLVRADLIIAPSAETASITRSAFGVTEDRVVITGYPRNDLIVTEAGTGIAPDSRLPASFARAVKADETVFLYLPTFRDSNSSYMEIDWRALDALMARTNSRFFFKTHPMDKTEVCVNSDRIIELPAGTDVYDAMAHIDALISDYSSIIFDYMLLAKPIVYYTPDLEKFVSGSRSLNFHPADVAVGPMCSDYDELAKALERIATGHWEEFAERRKEIMPRLHEFVDAGSSERVLRAIRERF